jgi:Zn-dependent oligopeptidase
VNKLLRKGYEDKMKLAGLKQEYTGDPNAKIYAWDKSFYNNLMRQKEDTYVDEEKIKEYFPTKHVVNECMNIFGEMLDCKFNEINTDLSGKWHEEV